MNQENQEKLLLQEMLDGYIGITQINLLERAIDKFIIDNKICSKKFTKNHQNESIHSD
jgi:hypothetical protein